MDSTVTPSTSREFLADRGEDAGILAHGRQVLARECEAITAAQNQLGTAFVEAVRSIRDCTGRIVVTGMGKAGLIGRKIQATLASTATPSFALHPAEAIHGDLGMVRSEDAILALTNSGETQELVQLLPVFRKLGCTVILITGRPRSKCAMLADIVLSIGDVPEACPLGLAPSSSTTAMLALGDALALTVMKLRNVQPEQYAVFHPGGALGRSLMRVHEMMRTGADCPRLDRDDAVGKYFDVVKAAPRRAGAATVVDPDGTLIGFFTDGDFRRCFNDGQDPRTLPVADVMTADPKFCRADDWVADALRLMQKYKIDELPVVDHDQRVVGLLDVQDLLARGFTLFDDP